jgi:hypothetical protein
VSTVRIVGLGPAGLDRLPPSTVDVLLDPAVPLILRTVAHPAAADLAAQRSVTACDDLYETAIGVAQRAVHATFGIGEHAVSQQPLQHATDPRLVISGFDRDQRQQARADRTDTFPVDADLGFADTLDQGDHARLDGFIRRCWPALPAQVNR